MTPGNVLIIGNSHTVAPRVALEEDPGRWPDVTFDVFALPPASLARLAIEDEVLVPTSARAQEHMLRHNRIRICRWADMRPLW